MKDLQDLQEIEETPKKIYIRKDRGIAISPLVIKGGIIMSGCKGCKYIKNEIGSYPCNRCVGFCYHETDITQSENKVEIRVGDVIQYSDSTSEDTRFGKVLTIYDNIKNPYKLIVEVKELGGSFLNPAGVEILHIDLQDVVNVYRERVDSKSE